MLLVLAKSFNVFHEGDKCYSHLARRRLRSDTADDDGLLAGQRAGQLRTPSWVISESLQAYVNRTKLEMEESLMVPGENDGVQCEGEPAVDPSRQIRGNEGDSEWMDDW